MRTALVLLAVALPAAALAEGPLELSVDEAVREAIAQSPRVEAARERARAAGYGKDAVTAHLLPGLHLSDEQQHYKEPWAVEFPLPTKPGAPPLAFTARNINTNTFVAAAGEPLTGLLRLGQERGAVASQQEAARDQVAAAEAAVREEVQSGYLRLFEARALAQIARASQEQLRDQMQVTKARLAAGSGTRADVLRLEVAAANARQQEIQAEAQEQVSRAGLLEALGRAPDEAGVDFSEPVALENAAAQALDLGASVREAVSRRPEIAAANAAARAAGHSARAKLFALLPDVSLEAAWAHIHGESLAPADSTFVGLKLEWTIFDWGADLFQRKAASAQASAAEQDAVEARRRVGTEVSARLAQARAAASAMDAAQAAIASAEEAYRVTDALVKAGSATTTDLLDAQGALTQARLNLVRARYEHAIARVALSRALGE